MQCTKNEYYKSPVFTARGSFFYAMQKIGLFFIMNNRTKVITSDNCEENNMGKIAWKPGTMLYPVPAVLVTSRHAGRDNVLTVSWTGTICTEPPMLYISLRPERHSYAMIKASKEFVVNVPTADMAREVDFCGVKSGAEVDKFKAMGFNKRKASVVKPPVIAECPLAIECRVEDIVELGSHHMIIARVLAVLAEESLIDKRGRFHLEDARLLCYNHGHYCAASKPMGKFGYSVQRKKAPAQGKKHQDKVRGKRPTAGR